METTDSDLMSLDEHEPVFHIEDDGLGIKGYEIDGRFIVDFDWEPGSQWEFLDDEEAFQDYVARWLEVMTGEPMSAVEVKALQVARESGAAEQAICPMPSGQDLAGNEDGKDADAGECACDFKQVQ
jgi:hypothetical protein